VTLMRSSIEGLPLLHRGKVRETYAVGDDPPATIPAAVAVPFGPPLVIGAPVGTKGLVP